MGFRRWCVVVVNYRWRTCFHIVAWVNRVVDCTKLMGVNGYQWKIISTKIKVWMDVKNGVKFWYFWAWVIFWKMGGRSSRCCYLVVNGVNSQSDLLMMREVGAYICKWRSCCVKNTEKMNVIMVKFSEMSLLVVGILL